MVPACLDWRDAWGETQRESCRVSGSTQGGCALFPLLIPSRAPYISSLCLAVHVCCVCVVSCAYLLVVRGIVCEGPRGWGKRKGEKGRYKSDFPVIRSKQEQLLHESDVGEARKEQRSWRNIQQILKEGGYKHLTPALVCRCIAMIYSCICSLSRETNCQWAQLLLSLSYSEFFNPLMTRTSTYHHPSPADLAYV